MHRMGTDRDADRTDGRGRASDDRGARAESHLHQTSGEHLQIMIERLKICGLKLALIKLLQECIIVKLRSFQIGWR